MDNSIDMLLALSEHKNCRAIYRFSPNLSLFPGEPKEGYQTRISPIADYCAEVLKDLQKDAAAVMFDYSAFAFYGVEGLLTLSVMSGMAKSLGYYVIIDGCFSGEGAFRMCESYFYSDSGRSDLKISADAVTLSPYIPAGDMREIARLCREEDKAVFICAKAGVTDDKDSFENIKTDKDMLLYEAAADDAGAFGENYVGEKGYSVMGFMTVPVERSADMRDLDRWGIALVKASARDLDDDKTYAFFYPRECEGEFVVITDRDIADAAGLQNGSFDPKSAADFFRSCIKKVEKKRLEKK